MSSLNPAVGHHRQQFQRASGYLVVSQYALGLSRSLTASLIVDSRNWGHWVCYTPSHPKTHWVFGDHAMGYKTSVSSIIPPIHSIHHHDYSIYSSIPEICSPSCFTFLNFTLFHVPVLLRIFVSLVLFLFPEPRPWYMPDSRYPDMILFDTYTFQPHVCSSVWNRHWLSLELLVQTSKPSSVPLFRNP